MLKLAIKRTTIPIQPEASLLLVVVVKKRYSTCTFDYWENEGQCQRFLAELSSAEHPPIPINVFQRLGLPVTGSLDDLFDKQGTLSSALLRSIFVQ